MFRCVFVCLFVDAGNPPAEDRPQDTSTLKRGNLEKEDELNKTIPKEAERVASRLL
jgi:hypothetical protein